MRFRGAASFLVLLAGSPAFGAYFYELSTASPQRLATYDGGGQFRGTLYEGATAATASQIGVFASQCVDFLNTFPTDVRFQVSVSSLTAADMANTRWGSWDGSDSDSTRGEADDFDSSLSGASSLNALQRYMMAAWYSTRLATYTSNPTSQSNNDRNAIQYIIWELLNPRMSSSTDRDPDQPDNTSRVAFWWSQGQSQGLTQGDAFYSQFRIITENPISGTPGNGSSYYQEQIIRVPEPVDITLALALIAVFWLVRRRRAVPA